VPLCVMRYADRLRVIKLFERKNAFCGTVLATA
jgi:hypothetical protein